jgi:hypothetical protein
MVMAAPALVSLWLRWRRGSFEERNQIKWLGLSMLWLLGAFFASMTIFGLSQQVIDVLLAAGLIGVWVGIGIAVTQYHLYDIGRVVSKTVTYALVVGVLGLVVAGVAAVVGAQFEDPLVVAATTLVIAALFNPVRKRVQRMVDRHFNRSRYDAQMVMDAFAGSLRDEVEPETVLAGWLEVVSETMQPEAVGVWVKK